MQKKPAFPAGKRKISLHLFNLDCIVQISIHQNASAVLTYHDLLVLFDLTLLLRRNGVEATTTSITLYGHYSQSIAIALADLVITGKQALIYMFSCLGRIFIKMFL